MTQVNTFMATTDHGRLGRLLTGSMNYAVSKLVVHGLLQVKTYKRQDSTHDFSVKLSPCVHITIVVAPCTYLSACMITYVYLVTTTPQLHEVCLPHPCNRRQRQTLLLCKVCVPWQSIQQCIVRSGSSHNDEASYSQYTNQILQYPVHQCSSWNS